MRAHTVLHPHWLPAWLACWLQNCNNALEVRERVVDAAVDVKCGCGCMFCFNCKEEAHRPVICEVVKKWITKNSAESENMNWILANTKPCPKCKRPIEKNQVRVPAPGA